MQSATYNTTPRWLSIVLGIVSILLGVLFWRNPGVTLVALSLLLAFYFLMIGITSLIGMFTGAPGSKWWKLIGGILAIVAGVLLLARPMLGAVATGTAFTFLVAAMGIISGIGLLIDGFSGGGCLSIILGILGILFGTWLLFNPLSGVLALPILLALTAIIGGIAAIIGAIFRPSPPPPPPPAPKPVPPPATRTVTPPPAAVKAPEAPKAAPVAPAAAAAAVAAASKPVSAKQAEINTWIKDNMGVEDMVDWAKFNVSDINPEVIAKLKAGGVESPAEVLRMGATPSGRAQLARILGVPEDEILDWVNLIDLRRIKGVGDVYSVLLKASGVDTVKELAARNPANLHATMVDVNNTQAITEKVPSEVEVADWVAQAKVLPAVVTY